MESKIKDKKALFIPEKSNEAAQKLKRPLSIEVDFSDSFAMFVMAFSAIGMKLDVIYLWMAWFALFSLYINQGKTQSPLPQSLISWLMSTFTIAMRYYQMSKGNFPPPNK